MKIVIVGAGAMGGLVGALLTESGIEATLYDISREQVEAIRKHGLIIERENKRRVVKVHATNALHELGQADLLIVLVKSYDTQRAVQGVKDCISPETLVLTLQNGEGNVAAISRVIPAQQILAGVTSHGAMLLSPGIVRHNGGAKTFIGPVDRHQFPKAEEVARLFNQAGIETIVSQDIQGTIWTKLLANAAINPLTAIMGCTNGALLEDESLLAVMENIVEEGKKAAAAAGIKLFREDMFDYVKSVCTATRENKSSMLMDILKGRRTEIDAINGMVTLIGEKNGQGTPVNQCVTQLVHALEKGRKQQQEY